MALDGYQMFLEHGRDTFCCGPNGFFEPDHTGLDMVQKGFDKYKSRCDITLLRYGNFVTV